MVLIKPPFKKYRGIKHCIVCDKYIPPTVHYNQKIYCDEHCREIAILTTRLRKLCQDKNLSFNRVFLRKGQPKISLLFNKIKAFFLDIVRGTSSS